VSSLTAGEQALADAMMWPRERAAMLQRLFVQMAEKAGSTATIEYMKQQMADVAYGEARRAGRQALAAMHFRDLLEAETQAPTCSSCKSWTRNAPLSRRGKCSSGSLRHCLFPMGKQHGHDLEPHELFSCHGYQKRKDEGPSDGA
jgi:hypothetical protein